MNLARFADRPTGSVLRRAAMLAALVAALILGSVCVTGGIASAAEPEPVAATITIDQDGRCASHDPCPAIVDGALTPGLTVPHVLTYDPTSRNRLDALDESHPCVRDAGAPPVAERLHVDLCVWRT